MVSLLESNKPNKMPKNTLKKDFYFNKHLIFTPQKLDNLHLHDTLKH